MKAKCIVQVDVDSVDPRLTRNNTTRNIQSSIYNLVERDIRIRCILNRESYVLEAVQDLKYDGRVVEQD